MNLDLSVCRTMDLLGIHVPTVTKDFGTLEVPTP